MNVMTCHISDGRSPVLPLKRRYALCDEINCLAERSRCAEINTFLICENRQALFIAALILITKADSGIVSTQVFTS